MTDGNCGINGLTGVLLLQVEGRSGGAVARESWDAVVLMLGRVASAIIRAMEGSANRLRQIPNNK